jgi:tetratricopeptide (TPR) repeat protein
MSPRRGHPCALPVAAVVVLGVCHAVTVRATPMDDLIAQERDHFGKGVALAHQERFDEALREFEVAYQTKHNFWVLFNLAQAHVALEHTDDAIQILGKYLSDGRGHLPRKRIQEVTKQLDELARDLQLAREDHASPPDVLAGGPGSGTAADGARAALPALVPPIAQLMPERAQPLPGPPGQMFPPVDDAPRSNRHTRISPAVFHALAISGAALGAASIGVYFWNRSRFDDWSTTNSALRQQVDMPGYEERQLANNRRASTISQISTLDVALALTAGALLASDAVIWFANRRAPEGSAAPSATRPMAALDLEWRVGSGPSVNWNTRW